MIPSFSLSARSFLILTFFLLLYLSNHFKVYLVWFTVVLRFGSLCCLLGSLDVTLEQWDDDSGVFLTDLLSYGRPQVIWIFYFLELLFASSDTLEVFIIELNGVFPRMLDLFVVLEVLQYQGHQLVVAVGLIKREVVLILNHWLVLGISCPLNKTKL